MRIWMLAGAMVFSAHATGPVDSYLEEAQSNFHRAVRDFELGLPSDTAGDRVIADLHEQSYAAASAAAGPEQRQALAALHVIEQSCMRGARPRYDEPEDAWQRRVDRCSASIDDRVADAAAAGAR